MKVAGYGKWLHFSLLEMTQWTLKVILSHTSKNLQARPCAEADKGESPGRQTRHLGSHPGSATSFILHPGADDFTPHL